MYSSRPGLILGFHGCDRQIAHEVLIQEKNLKKSEKAHEWLGHGIYFWENSPSRALQYAKQLKLDGRKNGPSIKDPAVLGAVIDLGFCFDLMDYQNLEYLKMAYDILKVSVKNSGLIPQNKNPKNSTTDDFIIRNLDCAVIQTVHQSRADQNLPPFDSVRAVFWEGKVLYPTAGFKEKTHIQICVINPNCIKGYFLPRKAQRTFGAV
ncbi:MAG: hypothetical protein U0U09_04555 [Cyclobacteriaceae bacterium]|jgi:hypothetical protein